MERIDTQCCIAGGGPAGMVLGLLLARAGVDVVVLEKHADFLRDFRGDTIHPSTLELMHELGLLDAFLKLPHQEVTQLAGIIGKTRAVIADFSHLPTRCKFVAIMPQWHFLNFLADHAKALPSFHLRMRADVTGLIEARGRIAGVVATSPDGSFEVHARLVVGADGRHSTVRTAARLEVDDLGAPIDVLWLRLSKEPGDALGAFGHFDAGHVFVMIDRGDYWQCAFVIPKGGFDVLRRSDIGTFHKEIVALQPAFADRVTEIRGWDDVKLLTVKVDRLPTWYRDGLLCIGDAAHAMSPIGGVGINLAIQDAVAAANLLAAPLRAGRPSVADLAAVQRRRALPTRITQWFQVLVQNRVISAILASQTTPAPPLPVKLIDHCPWLRRIPARLIGLGIRPEHLRDPVARGGVPSTS